jgi:hypothetical protein
VGSATVTGQVISIESMRMVTVILIMMIVMNEVLMTELLKDMGLG